MYKIGIIGYTGMVGMELTRLIRQEIDRGLPLEIVYTKNSKGETGPCPNATWSFWPQKIRSP